MVKKRTAGVGNAKTVAVIGLGYVGLPLAVRAVERGYRVYGIARNRDKIAMINRGETPIEDAMLAEDLQRFIPKATDDPAVISEADIILLCIPTPVDEFHNPDLTPVREASEMAAVHAKKGALVVLESTVNPGVSEEVIRPIFEEHGFAVGKDIHIAHCPERINPGDEKWTVKNIPRVVGSFEKKGLALALDFYRSIIDAEIRPMRSIREAEAVKIIENSFRDINIAFVNELARSFDVLGIDTKDVIEGAATKPFAFMPHYPSCGVGGHCIPVDPYYLIERAKRAGFDHRFLKIARDVNNSMPAYAVELLQDELNGLRMPLNGTRIGVLGISYKANIDDVRESPTFEIIKELERHGAVVATFDPHVRSMSTEKSLGAILRKSDAIILATNHREFVEAVTPELLEKHGVRAVIDGKNCLDKGSFRKSKIRYKGIGR